MKVINKIIFEAIKQFGVKVEILPPESASVETFAIICPLKHTKDLPKIEALGEFGRTQYLYIGCTKARLDLYQTEETIIKTKDESFVLKKAEKYVFGESIGYIWAILEKEITPLPQEEEKAA